MHLFAIPDSRSKSFKIEPEIKIRDSVQIEFGLVRSMASGCLLFSFLIIKRLCSQSNVTIILLKYNLMLQSRWTQLIHRHLLKSECYQCSSFIGGSSYDAWTKIKYSIQDMSMHDLSSNTEKNQLCLGFDFRHWISRIHFKWWISHISQSSSPLPLWHCDTSLLAEWSDWLLLSMVGSSVQLKIKSRKVRLSHDLIWP